MLAKEKHKEKREREKNNKNKNATKRTYLLERGRIDSTKTYIFDIFDVYYDMISCG